MPQEAVRRAGLPIPVDDPQEALRYCRSLARLLAERPEIAGMQAVTLAGGDTATALHPELSVVMPVYNEAENIPALHTRLTEVMQAQGAPYELVFVDDGSTDGSLGLLRELSRHGPHMVVVELARNFGHQVAISAGMDFARGDAVVVMDSDLQDPPEVLPQFIAKWQEGYDVVYGVREQRKESWPMRVAYAGFYRLLRRMADVDIPLDAGDFCLLDRRVVDLLCAMPERNRFVRGIRSWVGLRQIGVPYRRGARQGGRPKYTIGHLMLLALEGFVSFSHVPLRAASLLGIAISLASLALAVFYFVKRVVSGLNPPGFATLVVAVLFLAGVQLITLGIIGEYVGRTFDEVKQRPLYIVRRVLNGNPDADPDA
jgi:dolichol-phosphate mannosyltransferase